MMVDARQMLPTTHVIDTDYNKQFCWATRQLHTFRKTICQYRFTETDRRLFGSTPGTFTDHQLLEALPRCEACSLLLEFAIANSYVHSIGIFEPRFDLVAHSFEWVRAELEKHREG